MKTATPQNYFRQHADFPDTGLPPIAAERFPPALLA